MGVRFVGFRHPRQDQVLEMQPECRSIIQNRYTYKGIYITFFIQFLLYLPCFVLIADVVESFILLTLRLLWFLLHWRQFVSPSPRFFVEESVHNHFMLTLHSGFSEMSRKWFWVGIRSIYLVGEDRARGRLFNIFFPDISTSILSCIWKYYLVMVFILVGIIPGGLSVSDGCSH